MSMNKIFIASSLDNKDNVKILMSKLINRGYEITKDWTRNITDDYNDAVTNLEAIDNCDVFIFYLSETKSSGKMFEFGYAEALKKPIIIFGNKKYATSIYFKLNRFDFCDNTRDLLISLY